MLDKVRSFIDIRLLIFMAVFAATALLVSVLPTMNAFWRIMDLRFSKDERYQMQSLFLPDRNRIVRIAIAGDSMFHSAVTAHAGSIDGASRIVINGYDSGDVSSVLTAIRYGSAYTETRVCTLLLQISPNFAVRAKSQHVSQLSDLMPMYVGRGQPHVRIMNFFSVLDKWFHSQDSGNLMDAPHLRVDRHVGQARFADPSEENWKQAFSRLKDTKVQVLGILDVRGTDWGEDGNLLQETERLLARLSESSNSFSWVHLENFQRSSVPPCPQKTTSAP